MKKDLPVAITIAGSDSGGGAGIQADLKTFAVMGVHGTSAITSITAQNTVEVRAIHDIPLHIIEAQILTIYDDIGIDAGKTGMLSSKPIIDVVAKTIKEIQIPLVVDPVMIAKSGAKLLRDDAIESLIKNIIPLATVVTPNIPEAEVIIGRKIRSPRDLIEAAQIIVEEKGAEAAVVKGGHLEQEYSTDYLYYNGKIKEIKSPRIQTKNTHGTGCSFSAAIAAGLAKGKSIEESVEIAKKFISMAIDYGLNIGKGHGPVNPLAWTMIPAQRYQVLQNIKEAIEILRKNGDKVVHLIPEIFTNIAMAIEAPYARTPLDVASIPGRIARYKGNILVKTNPEFGLSRYLSSIILNAMKFDHKVRSAANIKFDNQVESIVKEKGYDYAYKADNDSQKNEEEHWINNIIRKRNRVPQIVFVPPKLGKEPQTIVLGRNATEVAEMIVEIAEKYIEKTNKDKQET